MSIALIGMSPAYHSKYACAQGGIVTRSFLLGKRVIYIVMSYKFSDLIRVPDFIMKVAGFLLLLAGWALVLATLALLGAVTARIAFVLAGVAVEVVGLLLFVRAHLPIPEDRP
ncbi:MAG: hypothetical protein ACRD2S_01615 [Terriglobales bacterium]